jgi:hypothetical protein
LSIYFECLKMKLLLTILILFPCAYLNALTTYTVGAGGTHTTILSAYNACTAADVYIIEIRSDYTQEALPIVLGTLANKSSLNTVTIRPQSGVSGLSLTNTATEDDIIQLTSANYVIIDGRPGGSGSGDFTISNNQTAKGHAVKIAGTCTEITVKYCTMKGSNSATGVGSLSTNAGVFVIGESGAGVLTTIVVDNCTITKGTGGTPTYLFVAFSSTGSIVSSTLSNSSLIDASSRFAVLSNGSSGYTISNNHFYQTVAITPETASGNPFSFIRVVTGGGHSITGNYMGGQAVLCGGSSFTINSSTARFHAISFNSSCTGTNTVNSNTIQNLAATTTSGTSPVMTLVNISGGGATYNIGTSGNGNTFGATTGTGSIAFTDNGASATMSIPLIYSAGTGAVNATYNSIGAITLAGSNTGGNFSSLYTSSSTTATFSNNTVGNTTASNMSDGIARTGWFYGGVYHTSSGTLNASSNIFQNYSLTGVSTGPSRFFDTSTAATVTLSSNTITNYTSSRTTGSFRVFEISIAGAIVVNSNVLSYITLSNGSSLCYLIDLDSSGGAITVINNQIGAFSANNITLAGDAVQIPIYINIASGQTASISNNIIQQINMTSTGTSAYMYGIALYGAGTVYLNYNIIQDITIASQNGSYPFIGVDVSNTGANNTLIKTRLDDISLTTTAAVSGSLAGIYLGGDVTGSTINKAKMTNLTNAATGSPDIFGIYSNTATAAWNIYNSIILISNGANTNACDIYGLYLYSSGVGTLNIYHNTIKISGSAAGGSLDSYPYLDFYASTSTRTVNNNIFYNSRTGGTGVHRALYVINTTGMDADYNYVESVDNLVNWGGTVSTSFANWQTIGSPDGANDTNGSLTIDALGAVTAGSAGTVANTGTDKDAIVPDDYDVVTRHATTPWMGAFESAVALPITFLSFEAENHDNQILLTWKSAVEVNVKYYEIEKSSNGLIFNTLLIKSAVGNSENTEEYRDFDPKPSTGINYYRLYEIDENGTKTYLKTISIRYNSESQFSVFPNPISLQHNSVINITNKNEIIQNLQLYNVAGSLVPYSFTPHKNSGTIQLPNNIQTGSYYIVITTEQEVRMKQITIIP